MNKTLGQKINELNKKQREIELEKEALYPTYFETEFHDEFFEEFEKDFPELKGKIKQVIFRVDNIYDDQGSYNLMVTGATLIDINDKAIETELNLGDDDESVGSYEKDEINEWVEQYLYDEDIDIISDYIDCITNPNI